MATGEDQPQSVIFDAGVAKVVIGVAGAGVVGRGNHGNLLELGDSARRAAQAVDGAVARGRGEPRAGIARDAVARPPLEGSRESILSTFLGQVPVAGHPDEGRDDAAPLRAEGGADRGLRPGLAVGPSAYISQTGLTSIVPTRAPGILAAISMASSRSLQSTR